MVSTTYRYRKLEPKQGDLRLHVPGSPIVYINEPYTYCDQTVDSANKTDLDEAMLQNGWAYVSTSPTTTPMTESIENMPIQTFTEKTNPVNADRFIIEDSADGYAKKLMTNGGVKGASFGQFYYKTESTGTSSATGTSWTQYLSLSLPSTIPAGAYRIHSWAFLGQNSKTYAIKTQIQIDNTTTLHTMTVKPIESSSSQTNMMSCTRVVNLTAGAHTIDLDYSSANATPTVYALSGAIEAWRIDGYYPTLVLSAPAEGFSKDRSSDVTLTTSGTFADADSIEVFAKITTGAMTSWGAATLVGSNWSHTRTIQAGDVGATVVILAVATKGNQKATKTVAGVIVE